MRRLAEGVPPHRHALRETGCSFSRDVSACNDSAISQTTVFRQSLVHEKPHTCNECRSGLIKRAARIVLEDDTWSGEDVFYARGLPGTRLTSERFKAFFDKYSINNGVLIDAAEYSFEFYPWESLKRGTPT